MSKWDDCECFEVGDFHFDFDDEGSGKMTCNRCGLRWEKTRDGKSWFPIPQSPVIPPRGGKLTLAQNGSFILACNCGGKIEGETLTPGVNTCPDCGLTFEFELVGLTRLVPLAETPDGIHKQMMRETVGLLDKPPG